MESAEIRRRWLDFFETRGHTVVPSASLVSTDPTLLLVNAGMVPFKPYFLGEEKPPFPRATSVQKCVRTNDIEQVGRTTRHGSFFQMNGNFSFGDYFKERAIPLAWELLTGSVADGGYGFPEDKLWATVYHDDDEAYDVWHKVVGLPAERIQRRGKADNFWSMGVPGPCGPCSEIYYDRGPEHGREGGPEADEERYLEVWNLVFMQFRRGEGTGKDDYEILGELPARNIDTGMGLERMATLLQGVENLYEIDTTRRVLDEAVDITGVRYGSDARHDVALRVIADHARTATMLIGDGVVPSNEGRGYVLRRMMRRTIRNLRLLGAQDPSFGRLVTASVHAMGPSYPELDYLSERIHRVATAEEDVFLGTLRTGTTILDVAVAQAKTAGATSLPAAKAFALHDTYGFPIDLTVEMAGESGLGVDTEGFRTLMEEQRGRAKAAARARKSGYADTTAFREVLATGLGGSAVTFTGYETTSDTGRVVGLLGDSGVVRVAEEGDEVGVVLDRTPFYAEGGGQLADAGRIELANGTVLDVIDVQQPLAGLVVHRARVVSGEVQPGAAARADVDTERRLAISRAHTATHMVHRAMRNAIGETAAQAGSENAPGRFRFDFMSPQAVPVSVLADVEAEVNDVLLRDLVVHAEVMPKEDAFASGAVALFGERYPDRVRVVSVGDYAKELCGGTHAGRSGQLGVVKLLSEGSIGSGVRRVEALVGHDAYRYLARENVLVNLLVDQMKVRREELPDRVAATLAKLRDVERELSALRRTVLAVRMTEQLQRSPDVEGVAVNTVVVPAGTSAADLRTAVSDARVALRPDRPAMIVGFAVDGAKVAVVVTVNDVAIARGLGAGKVLAKVAPLVGGRGGGRPEMAQGGGTRPDQVDAAVAAVPGIVRDLVLAGAKG